MWKCGHVCEPQRELAATCPGILIVPLGFARFQAPQHVEFTLDIMEVVNVACPQQRVCIPSWTCCYVVSLTGNLVGCYLSGHIDCAPRVRSISGTSTRRIAAYTGLDVEHHIIIRIEHHAHLMAHLVGIRLEEHKWP
ncbi:hypothetical protein J6590_098945 [Homalodisca vitripennis]|nr:hypothetical protein J6590_098945 [Homalodisca vitripennis]